MKRLETCISLVSNISDTPNESVVCDVGTDHAILPCELIKRGICKRAIAADIAINPLEIARKNIRENNLEDKIEVILSDGLENIHDSEINCIVIAGMGGETIADIIEKDNNYNNYKEKAVFILQPMTRAAYLRKYLYSAGFEIMEEKACVDSGKVYTVIKTVYTGKKKHITDIESVLGKLNLSGTDEKKYAEKQLKRFERIYNGRKKSGENFEKYKIIIDNIREAIKNAN